MTFAQAMISLQLMAEERIGSAMRANAQAAEQEQDDASAGLRKAFAN